MASAHQVPEFVAAFLLASGVSDAGEIERFLNPRLANLSDPNLLPGMRDAVARIDAALRGNQRIVLYGDYDVDGVASLALLHRLFNAYGVRVECFLPSRAGEGYGLSEAGIEKCVEMHSPELLIAVDCGTNSREPIARLMASGVDVIVLDHHEPDGQGADCCALVNPKLGDGAFSYLCSVGVAFKTAHALLKHAPLPGFELRELLDLVALATICDLVPLVDENRILVRRGLEQMAHTRWPGLAALLRISAIMAPIRASDVGFRLGPRINAAGRLGTAEEALALLLTNDASEAARIAADLDRQNRERQAVERTVARDIEAWVRVNFDPARDATIVAGSHDWHQGVIGIVASRIAKRHHRPTLVVSFDEDGGGKGSGRSIEGLSLVEALRCCESHLGNFGGHEMAAGLHVTESNFQAFRECFELVARSMVTPDMLVPRIHVSAEVVLGEFGDDLLSAQSLLEPFGSGNQQPLLVMRGVSLDTEPRVLKEKHVRFTLRNGRQPVTAIFFNGAEADLPRPPWDIAFHLERNDYNGRCEPQMNVVAIRPAA